MLGKMKMIHPVPVILLVSLLVVLTGCSSTTTGEVQKSSTTPPVTAVPALNTENTTLTITTPIKSNAASPINTSKTPVSLSENITAAHANALIQANTGNPDFVILDVRTPDEFASGHLSGAINIDYEAATFKDDIQKLDKDFTYLVYCRTGVRSAMAQSVMKEAGFKNVTSLIGGITEWMAEGFTVVK